jgi:ribosomal-protein-alanine N-acetyltransferase
MSRAVPGLDDALVKGKLVFLRHPTESDRDEFIALRNSCKEYLARWEPVPPRGFDAFGDDGFDREVELARTDRGERMLICRREDGTIVGKLSTGDILRGPAQFCHLGYWIAEAHAGRGYMTEAIALGLRYCFTTLKLHRVEANIQPHNEASRRVVQRNGFRLEGFSPRYIKIRGRWADHERWAITVEEWRARKRQAP